MSYRRMFNLLLLFALLSAALSGCAPKTEKQSAAPAVETPAPLIRVKEPEAAGPTAIPAPTATPADNRPYTCGSDVNGLIVSEVLFSAKGVRYNGKAVSFVELYNGSGTALDLSGYCLSDRFDKPEKYALPARTLAPDAYLVLPLGGAGTEEADHIPFSLSEDDDGLMLSSSADRLAVRYIFPERPARDVSVAPQTDGSMRYLAYATPGKKNAAGYETAAARESALLRGVYFSEVSAEGAGWIELKNGGSASATLTGWHWTDNKDKPDKELLSGRIEAGGTAVFRPKALRLSASGETLWLYDADGFLRDSFRTGVLNAGRTSGRSDTPERVFYSTPTEGRPNSGGSPASVCPAPVFSETWLYQKAPFLLTLTCADPDARIYYTLDGSEPNEKSACYSAPLRIEKNISVRAFAVCPGKEASPHAAAHFIVGETHTLPVVYIDMDPGLFKRLTNVPFDEGGLKEQACFVSFYGTDGRIEVSFPAGIKPRGNASISYPQKSLSLHLRKRYGLSSIRFDFWDCGETGPYEALVLRNSGQDTSGCHLRDAFAQTASRNLRMDTQRTRPVIVYVNGGYYGVLDLNENMNKATFALRYGVKEDNINIVQRNNHVVLGSADGFVALRRYAMTKNFKDDAVVAKYAEELDLGAVTDYIIAQSFFGNYDIHNQNYWSSADGTVTWRPFLYDVDRCLNAESMRSNVLSMYFNKAGIVHDRQGDRIWMDMYCALKNNQQWRDAFLDRYAYLLCNDLSTETLLSLFDGMADTLRPEMERHADRFGTPSSLKEWEKNVNTMRRNIIDRKNVIVKNIRSVFKLSEKEWAAIIAPYETKAAEK